MAGLGTGLHLSYTLREDQSDIERRSPGEMNETRHEEVRYRQDDSGEERKTETSSSKQTPL